MDLIKVFLNKNDAYILINGKDIISIINSISPIKQETFKPEEVVSLLLDIGETHKIGNNMYIHTDIKGNMIIWEIKKYEKTKYTYKFDYDQYRYEIKKVNQLLVIH